MARCNAVAPLLADARHNGWPLDAVAHCPQLGVPLETAELILGITTK